MNNDQKVRLREPMLTVPKEEDFLMDARGRLLCKCPTCNKEFTSVESYIDSRSRFKEEVLRALEGMKRVTAFGAVDGITMGENGRYNDVIQDAIETIKGL